MKRVNRDDGHTAYLPEEIIEEILKRLPVKSLIRFQSVCKHWKNLFQTSSFIANHHRHSDQNNFLLFECYGECNPYDECNPMHLCFMDRELRIGKVHNAPCISSDVVVRIVNSCNGLLCVGLHGQGIDGRSSFLVYNLATRQVRRVCKPFINECPEVFCLGFGFCPILNDFKIVRVRVSGNHFYVPFDGAEVFSVSTGEWKILEDENLKNVILFYNVKSFACDGAIFWFGSKRVAKREYVRLIVSFDINMEAFSLIPMPPPIHFNFNTNFTLYENKLGVLHPIESPESCQIELWVMEEDKSAADERERWSWTKRYTSNPYPCLLLPRAIWRNEIVCTIIDGTHRKVKNFEVKIVLINLTTNEFNTFAHHGFDPSHGIFNHVESLVSIKNFRSYKA